jgi:hypothetical protein
MSSSTQPRSVASITRTRPRLGSGILRPFPSEDLPTGIDPFVFLDTGALAQWGTAPSRWRPIPTVVCLP